MAVERKCPFCNSVIDEQVLLYGGSCPKCFGEIPGEEAATDPGAVVRARQAASDKRRMWWKALVPVALAVPVVGMVFVIAVGFVIWNRDPYVEVMNFDEGVDLVEYEIVSAPEPQPEPVPVPGQQPVPVAPRPSNDGIADAGNLPPMPDVVAPRPQPSSVGGLNFGGLEVRTYREGEVLSDPGQIFQMIKQKMNAYQGQFKECYDRRLKTKPDLGGSWRAKFVVGPDGFAREVSFSGTKMKDAEFEQCLTKKVQGWKFVKISQPQPVEKTWSFRPR